MSDLSTPRSINISIAILEDLPRLLEIYVLAYSRTVLFQARYGGVAPREYALHHTKTLQHYFNAPTGELWKAEKDGQIVGWAFGMVQGGRPERKAASAESKPVEESTEMKKPEEKKNQPVLPPGTNVELALEFGRKMGEEGYAPTEKNYYIDCVAVDPSYQGAGIASLLVKTCIAQAEKANLDVFLYAADGLSPFYEKFGFSQCAPEVKVLFKSQVFIVTAMMMQRSK